MRLLFFMLLFLNAVAFGYSRYAESRAGAGTQIALLQISPEKIKLLKAGAQAERKPPSAACLEWGGFGGDDTARAADAIGKLALGDKLSQRGGDVYWVYVPPAKTKADANKTAADIKTLGLADVYVMPDNDPLHFAISLGVFKTEDAANSYLAQIKQKGVRSAVVNPRGTKGTIFVVRDPGDAVTAKIAELKASFPNSELKAAACAAAPSKS